MSSEKPKESLILVVDDNRDVLDSLRRLLEAEQYAVLCAETVAEAQSLLQKHVPNLVLSDIFLPDQDGFSLYDHVRGHSLLTDVPFVFLTAHDSEEQRLQATREGCDDYLLKPIEPEILLAVVEGKLQRARQLNEVSTKKMQAIYRRIIHTLSHEFRTPLVSIQAGAELLLDRIEDVSDPSHRMILEAILTGGRRLERLVEDFMLLQQLDMSTDLSHRPRVNCQVALSRVVEETIEGFVAQRRLSSKHPTVQFAVISDEDVEDRTVLGEYLSDIILRLLENAYKFGGANNPIDVQVVLSAPAAEVVIRDYGPGFLQDTDAERVFEPFLQLKREVYEQQGCGIGLTIAQFLAQINGCAIRFSKPKEGPGVAAHVLIPVLDEDVDEPRDRCVS